jgi:hypothetical protein
MRNETGKDRQSRIEQDYFRRDGIVRMRCWVALGAMSAAVGWPLLAPLWDSARGYRVQFFERSRLASPGALAHPHAMWESRCTVCHVPFQAINPATRSPLQWLTGESSSQAGDSRCVACHAGPAHHQTQIPTQVPACAECHRDHRGRDTDLKRIDDELCTSCHADLNSHRTQDSGIASTVTRFDEAPTHHPEFTILTRNRQGQGGDPGTLKFNHSLHLASGLNLQSDEKAPALLTYAQLSDADRKRYGWKPGEDLGTPVQLDCTACHRLDGEEAAEMQIARTRQSVLPRNSGAYMLPVIYESHCRSCHPLKFDPRFPTGEMRHGLTPRELLEELRQFYAAQATNADPELLRRFVPARPVPGRQADQKLPRVEEAIDQKILAASRILLGSGQKGCAECHELAPSPVPLVHSADISKTEVRPVNIPRLWFVRARFDHSAHRSLQCLVCHPQASASSHNSQLLLPGIEICASCHGTVRSEDRHVRGGAGSHCTECHMYHNGDHPLQGNGASARGVADRRTVNELLNTGADTR